MRLAYLCNLYPAVSHSFVRREIEAVERAGCEVHRFSVRPARADLKDGADLREAGLTEAVCLRKASGVFCLRHWFCFCHGRPGASQRWLRRGG